MQWTSQPASAWYNGEYSTSLKFDYDTQYGTHDWILDCVIDLLMKTNATRWQWLSDRRTIAFVGSESPDNEHLSVSFNDTVITGLGNEALHRYYFNWNGQVLASPICSLIKNVTLWIAENNTMQQLDLVAYNMGILAHYISDLSLYMNVALNNTPPYNYTYEQYRQPLQNYILTRTNEHGNRDEFFFLYLTSALNFTPTLAMQMLAWEVFADPRHNGSYDANWLYLNHFSGWVLRYEDRISDTLLHRSYYDRMEEIINQTVIYTAAALQYCLNLQVTIPPTDINEDDSSSLSIAWGIGIGSGVVGCGLFIYKQRKRKRGITYDSIEFFQEPDF